MLCQNCKQNEATVYYRESVNGKIKSYALCAHCAADTDVKAELGKMLLSHSPFDDSLSNIDALFGSLFGVPHYGQKVAGGGKKCTLCGATFSDLVSDGKAGCPTCYSVFSDELAETINRIHGTTVHSGGAPSRFRQNREKKQRISELEGELKRAIAEENYERAAQIRDELKEMRESEKEDQA